MKKILFTKICVICTYVTLAFGEKELENSQGPILPNSEQWWGPIEAKSQCNEDIEPFKIKFEDEAICDLKDRIYNRRHFNAPLDGVGFQYGFNTDQLDGWMDYWANNYNFTERENYLNQFPQYKTNIQGLDMHFMWVKPQVSPDVEVVPLLLLHGWPGSITEFYKAIPLLTAACEERGFAVEVVAPSLPGFGFSDGAVRPSMGSAEMAVVLRNLMHRLGFQKFYVQGGDWGALTANSIATLFQEEILGYHSNFALSLSPASLAVWVSGSINLSLQSLVTDSTLADRLYPLLSILKGLIEESGYLHLQSTKSDTIGVAMCDTPSGLLAYMLQIISMSSRNNNKYKDDGGLLDIYTRDELIDNLMMYWIPNKCTTAARIYANSFNVRTVEMGVFAKSTTVLTWTAHAKDELIYQSPAILKMKFTNLLNSTVFDDYGHHLALEAPDAFADDVVTALAAFRRYHATNYKEEL